MSLKQFLLATALCLGASVNAVQAGTIIVSGDSSIGNGIDGGAGAAVEPGNTTFFTNILGAGTKVLIQAGSDDSTLMSSYDGMATLYNGLPGVSATTILGAPTVAQLTGINLFISSLPDAAYDSATIAALSSLLSGGGTVFFLSDADGLAPGAAPINADLAALGASLAIVPATLDASFHFATGASIDADPYTAGITSFEYAYTSQVTGGKSLFTTTDGTTFLARTTVDAAPVTGVPEPATLALLGAGVAGAAAMRRRKIKKV